MMAERRFLGAKIHVLKGFLLPERIPDHVFNGNNLLIKECRDKVRYFFVYVNLVVVLVLFREQIAAVEWVLQFKAVFLLARQIMVFKNPDAERVEFHQRRITVGMVVGTSTACAGGSVMQASLNYHPRVLHR